MENPIKMDDLGGKPTIFGNTHIYAFISILWILYSVFQEPIGLELSFSEIKPQEPMQRTSRRNPSTGYYDSYHQDRRFWKEKPGIFTGEFGEITHL